MTVRKTDKISRSLESKGFKEMPKKDHKTYYLCVDDKTTRIHTKFSHGMKEISDTLISKMAGQLYLTKAEFLSFVDCNLDGESYRNLLKSKDKL